MKSSEPKSPAAPRPPETARAEPRNDKPKTVRRYADRRLVPEGPRGPGYSTKG